MYILIQDNSTKTMPMYKLFNTEASTATSWGVSVSRVLSLPLTRNIPFATELKYSPSSAIIAKSTIPFTKESHPELFI